MVVDADGGCGWWCLDPSVVSGKVASVLQPGLSGGLVVADRVDVLQGASGLGPTESLAPPVDLGAGQGSSSLPSDNEA
ncbi:hypothetical protein JX265_010946 [Neoarthrinium moseri]|uniref:Uncharacterized protein n=1 Tax=Neoarthrinium moseri TaxID=1658444 RepID=A0A9P9WD80_9PEZI|nr:uncharacterized protein JN550_009689 [Neoarthrinium moseri]KAI1851712.1 hypothetical protein JX266_003174 [Neoarthrinium moseri]KAI1857916.1 hypothetical protein JX265_010946 [Neoarthrinium moseri]KAI1863369.1 hypothetical protein JN550_009689 [Neoarthrinium moseri]